MDKIIFLDIDGVLNVYGRSRDAFGHLFHTPFVRNLGWIIRETGAKIVISSTWRKSGLSVMKDMWLKRNLPGEVVGITPTSRDVIQRGTCRNHDEVMRGHEIQQYIDDNKIECYVIIDDDNDMLQNHKDKFFQASGNTDHPDSMDIGYGLTRKCAERAIEILNKSYL